MKSRKSLLTILVLLAAAPSASASPRWVRCRDASAATGYVAQFIHTRGIPCVAARENAFLDIARDDFAKFARHHHHIVRDPHYGRFACTSSLRQGRYDQYLHMFCAGRRGAYFYDVGP